MTDAVPREGRHGGSSRDLEGVEGPRVVELGVALDLTVVIAVAAILHERIFEEFGTGDSHVLRSLRD